MENEKVEQEAPEGAMASNISDRMKQKWAEKKEKGEPWSDKGVKAKEKEQAKKSLVLLFALITIGTLAGIVYIFRDKLKTWFDKLRSGAGESVA